MESVLSEYLKKMRIERGVSQKGLAEVLGYISGQYVSNYERGMCPVPIEKIQTLVDYLSLDLDYIVYLYQEDQKNQLMQYLDVKPKRKSS